MDVAALQQFATELRKTLSRKTGKTLSRKTIINVLGAVFAILDYAKRRGTSVASVPFADIQLGTATNERLAPSFTLSETVQIIAASKEPYKTLFALDWVTGLRAGEILALTVADLDFARKTIRVNKSADDSTREIHQPKTKNSTAFLPMASALEGLLKTYLAHHWRENPGGILFANRKGTRPMLRDNVVKYGLKPVLRKLGMPTKGVGLHAFRHGLATELADKAVPIPVLQAQMRHADVRTTLKVYAHAIPQTQRDVMKKVGQSISALVPIGTESKGQAVSAQ
jgi:integrase